MTVTRVTLIIAGRCEESTTQALALHEIFPTRVVSD